MEVRGTVRDGRGHVLLMAVLLAVLTGCGGSETGEPQVSTRPVAPSPRPGATTVLDRSCPSPTSGATPAPEDTKAHGWPDGGRNPAGVYSWEGEVYSYVVRRPKESGSREKETFSSTRRWMHNGYSPGSGHVNIEFEGVPGQLIPRRGRCVVTVAGYEGTYRRFTGKQLAGGEDTRSMIGREWMVDIQGTTVTILLLAAPAATEAELAEAHQIIESIYMEPKDNEIGFQLLFTIPTNTWDSG